MTTPDAPSQPASPSAPGPDSVAEVADPAERALGNFNDGLNCCESVLFALNDICDLGLSPEHRGIATPFGGGMSGAKEACGAVTGALMALGLARGRHHASQPAKPAVDAGKALNERFIAEFKTLRCKDLTCRFSWDQPERRQACQAYVQFAAGEAAAILAVD